MSENLRSDYWSVACSFFLTTGSGLVLVLDESLAVNLFQREMTVG